MGIEAAMTFTSSRYGWPTLLSACIKSADDARAAAIVRWCYDLSTSPALESAKRSRPATAETLTSGSGRRRLRLMVLSVCVTDDDYEAWRAIRIAVVPDERCDTVAELHAQDSSNRLLLLAVEDGVVVGSGMADKSETAGGGFAAPRVRPGYRRRGVGSALLGALAEHCTGLGLPTLRASVEDEGSLAFADRFGFVEVDRQVEQVRAIGDESPPPALPPGVEVVTLTQHPELWAACFDTFGTQVLADFAVYTPLEISAAQWNRSWAGDPMFLALYRGEVIGCAGLHRDTDRPDRGENALTGVRRDWRGRGVASHLKLRTLQWAAANGLRELYTWTQAGNSPMLRLNERLGYVTARNSITVSRPLPLELSR
jgi:mycothiol synthase